MLEGVRKRGRSYLLINLETSIMNPVEVNGIELFNINLWSCDSVGKRHLLYVLFFLTWCLIQLTNTIQKRLSVSSTQLLYQSAPFQAAILFVSGPFLDQCLTKKNVFAYKYSPVVLVCYCPLDSLYSCR